METYNSKNTAGFYGFLLSRPPVWLQADTASCQTLDQQAGVMPFCDCVYLVQTVDSCLLI